MRRPRKQKVEVAETTVEAGPEGENDTGETGVQQPGVDDSVAASVKKDPTAGPGHKRWSAALAAFEESSLKAVKDRAIVPMFEKEQKLAQRIHDAKMRRLDNGDKRKKRKSQMRAACRTYEAIIELQNARLYCMMARCRAAESERDAARAEMRVIELE